MQSTSVFLTRYPSRYSYTRTPLNNPPPVFSLVTSRRWCLSLPTFHSSVFPDLSKLIDINFCFVSHPSRKSIYLLLCLANDELEFTTNTYYNVKKHLESDFLTRASNFIITKKTNLSIDNPLDIFNYFSLNV